MKIGPIIRGIGKEIWEMPFKEKVKAGLIVAPWIPAVVILGSLFLTNILLEKVLPTSITGPLPNWAFSVGYVVGELIYIPLAVIFILAECALALVSGE